MPRTVVHMFSGQGDFSTTPLIQAAHQHPIIKTALADVFKHVDTISAGYGIPPLGPALLSDTPPSGKDLAQAPTGTHQLALFGAQTAIHRTLAAIGYPPDQLIGVSFGEIAALTAAGVFTIAGGARTSIRLARSLVHYSGGMLLLKAGESEAAALADKHGPDLAIACVNDPSEVIITGPLQPLDNLQKDAEQTGLHAARLRLPFLCHHPMLEAEAQDLAAALRRIPTRSARIPVYSAVHGRAYTAGDDIPRLITASLTKPTNLPHVLKHTAQRQGIYLEAGTGSALASNARRVLPLGNTVHAPLADAAFPWNPGGHAHA